MGERGPAPTPFPIKQVTGIGSHHPENKNPPRPVAVAPDCPDWLDDEAKVEWNNIVEKMEKVPGWLTEVNQSTLAGHAHWYSVWKQQEAILAKEGRSYEVVTGIDPETKEPMITKRVHPASRLAKDAWTSMMKCDMELGITPARGASVKLPTNTEDEEGLDHPGRRSA